MAWFGEGLSSLKGQLSNLAKNVLIDEDENHSTKEVFQDGLPDHANSLSQVDSGWTEAEEGVFIGQDDGEIKPSSEKGSNKPPVQASQGVESEVGLSKGITSLLSHIGGGPSPKPSRKKNAGTQASLEPDSSVQQPQIAQLTRQNAELLSEVGSLRRVVRDLESQIATSQDENANLSTGLEALDIQHQEAIERILTVKDEAVKELEQLRQQIKQQEEECASLSSQNQSLLKQVEMMKIDLLGNETLSQENAELREKLSELMKDELPVIPEQSVAEEHVRSLEAEVVALRESRDNLERETATLLNQLRLRDATLRQVDAKLEEVTKEKEIKEREMTQIVFECNSIREELKAASEKIDTLEKDGIESRSEISTLKSQLEDALEEEEVIKNSLENAKMEANMAKDESETLKSELESVRDELGGGEAQSLLNLKELEGAKKKQGEALEEIESLNQTILRLEEEVRVAEEVRGGLEEDRISVDKELNELRDLARDYGIQKDLSREIESELKQQLSEVGSQLASYKLELERLTSLNSRLEEVNASLSREAKLHGDAVNEVAECKLLISELSSEKSKMTLEVRELRSKLGKAEKDLESREKELSTVKSALQLIETDISGYQNVIKLLEVKIHSYEEQIRLMSSNREDNRATSENLKNLIEEKEEYQSVINAQSKEIDDLKMELVQLKLLQKEIVVQNEKLDDTVKQISTEKVDLLKEREDILKSNSNLLSELKVANTNIDELKNELSNFRNKGILPEEETQLRQQIDHLKDELSESYEEKQEISTGFAKVSSERDLLREQVQALRGELDSIPVLKQDLELAKQTIEEKVSIMEDLERKKNKEIETLNQEVNNLKTQLEFASQLLQHVERQEGEGQPSGEQANQKSSSSEAQEEISKLTATLLKEQTDKKILQNQLLEKEALLEKTETQLTRLKNHLMEVEDSYSSELSGSEGRLREMEAQLIAAEERARTSTTAYTSASIRSNQQVESLCEQVRLLNEHKERLEQQVSIAEDSAAKQAAAVTRLQAVLHHFQIDKQKDIEFETERIRRELTSCEKKNKNLISEMKILQEELQDAMKGIAAGQRLSDQLLHQSETISQLKSEIFELNEKLRAKEEKSNDLNLENKVDKQLVTNLLVGFVTAPAEARTKVLGVLSQVLTFSKEERQKVGLEPGGRQQTLSEAFIKFLQSESQPRPEVILPLAPTSSLPPSRKSSLLSPEVPSLPHFPVGRNPGSILKDVLQDRRPE